MKVLFLNPHLQPEHAVVKGLQAKGLAVVLPGNAQEAWQMLSLHGASLDLAIIHREDAREKDNEGGLKFVGRLKADMAYADIPVIVTSHRWGDGDFARHQESPQGANAYLAWPFDAEALFSLIQAVFGGTLPGLDPSGALGRPEATTATPSMSSLPPPGPPKFGGNGGSSKTTLSTAGGSPSGSHELVLEDASNLFGRNDRKERSDTSIRLEMPEPDQEAPVAQALPTASELIVPPPAERGVELIGGKEEVDISLSSIPIDPATGEVSPGLSDALSSVLAQGSSAEETAPRRAQFKQPKKQVPVEEEPEVSDAEAAQDMPYLFQKGPRNPAAVAFSLPLGDAVVPGGAAHAPDIETLKKYLLLREQDVAVLSTQLKATQEQVKTIEEQLRLERARNTELSHVTGEQKRKIDEFEKEKQNVLGNQQSELSELRFQLKARSDKARILEAQVREAADEMERLKERVRSDIRKIRVREKELENRLEIMKKDSEALISARENKIIELKRKLDLLEFNMDLLQDQHAREKENATKLRERLAKAAQVVRVAGGLLDNPAGASQLAAALAGEDIKAPGSEDVA